MADLLHFEDFAEGQVYDLGTHRIEAEEIIAYAREFDPQPQHLDAEAAKSSLLGGLAASGWQLCALAMRMIVDGLLHRADSQGSPGVDEVQWRRPVLAGDALHLTGKVLGVRASSKSDRGFVKFRFEMHRAGQMVMMFESAIIIGRRSS
ncbi:MAG: MaoC family dehydratase [Alphaproteobacteria bacterium]|nr:MaoC family dehydratase [Alphaproteobacteria bacterium]